MQNEQLTDAIHRIEELRQKRFKRGFALVSTEHFRADVPCAVVSRRADHAELPQVSGKCGLCHAPSALLQQSPQVLLARDRVATQELQNDLVPLWLLLTRFIVHGA